ncbi:hypothetical protein COBT_002776 [Conglomerata obtusa]
MTMNLKSLYNNIKSYQAWYQRKYMINILEVDYIKHEIKLIYQCLEKDERNFHCWNYYRFLVEKTHVQLLKLLNFEQLGENNALCKNHCGSNEDTYYKHNNYITLGEYTSKSNNSNAEICSNDTCVKLLEQTYDFNLKSSHLNFENLREQICHKQSNLSIESQPKNTIETYGIKKQNFSCNTEEVDNEFINYECMNDKNSTQTLNQNKINREDFTALKHNLDKDERTFGENNRLSDKFCICKKNSFETEKIVLTEKILRDLGKIPKVFFDKNFANYSAIHNIGSCDIVDKIFTDPFDEGLWTFYNVMQEQKFFRHKEFYLKIYKDKFEINLQKNCNFVLIKINENFVYKYKYFDCKRFVFNIQLKKYDVIEVLKTESQLYLDMRTKYESLHHINNYKNNILVAKDDTTYTSSNDSKLRTVNMKSDYTDYNKINEIGIGGFQNHDILLQQSIVNYKIDEVEKDANFTKLIFDEKIENLNEFIDEIIELENNCHFALLIRLETIKEERDRLNIIKTLAKIDPFRKNYYCSLHKSFFYKL